MCKLLDWLFPRPRLHIRKNVPWPHEDIRRVIEFCMQPFHWTAIDKHGIVITMSSGPLGHQDVGGATDGWVIALDSDTVGLPLSKTALAHELEHVRQLMLGNPGWREHTPWFLLGVKANNRKLKEMGL